MHEYPHLQADLFEFLILNLKTTQILFIQEFKMKVNWGIGRQWIKSTFALLIKWLKKKKKDVVPPLNNLCLKPATPQEQARTSFMTFVYPLLKISVTKNKRITLCDVTKGTDWTRKSVTEPKPCVLSLMPAAFLTPTEFRWSNTAWISTGGFMWVFFLCRML